MPTPIGNLEDFSDRSKKILSTVDMILCEDTRHTGQLLAHFKIKKPMTSLHEHNEKGKTASILEKVSAYESIALVTDSGTPGISDPGMYFIQEAKKLGVKIISIPGPSAMTCAMAASGFLVPKWLFLGFPSRTPSKLKKEFLALENLSPCGCIFFESPFRILKTLKILEECYGPDIQVSLSREISKIYETHLLLPVSEILNLLNINKIKGEIVFCIKF